MTFIIGVWSKATNIEHSGSSSNKLIMICKIKLLVTVLCWDPFFVSMKLFKLFNESPIKEHFIYLLPSLMLGWLTQGHNVESHTHTCWYGQKLSIYFSNSCPFLFCNITSWLSIHQYVCFGLMSLIYIKLNLILYRFSIYKFLH